MLNWIISNYRRRDVSICYNLKSMYVVVGLSVLKSLYLHAVSIVSVSHLDAVSFNQSSSSINNLSPT